MLARLVDEHLSTAVVATRLTAVGVLTRREPLPQSPATIYKIHNN
jgi:hypothetical protein